MKRTKEPHEMTLTELRKALPKERQRATNLRTVATERPDLGFGWGIAADSAEKNVGDIERLINEKSSKTKKTRKKS